MNTILLTEGNWTLKKFDSPAGHTYYYHFLDHMCEKATPDKYGNTNPWFWYKNFSVPCTSCGETPPEGLQALYVLLTDDCSTKSWWDHPAQLGESSS